MINDIREYYHNLTKLQKKKFEILFEELYDDRKEFYLHIDIYKVIQYLRISDKIMTGKQFNNKEYLQLTNILIIEIEDATTFLNYRKKELSKILEPTNEIDDSVTLSLILDLFQKVLK